MVQTNDQHRNAEHIGEENEFLTFLISDVAGTCQKLDPLEPLVFGQLHIGDEGMKMLDEAPHDLLKNAQICSDRRWPTRLA